MSSVKFINLIKLDCAYGYVCITGRADRKMTMKQLNLTETEVSTLKKTLDIYISDLRMEIADTEEKDFRDGLKQEEAILTKILNSLSS
jgi:hypothetical protein